MPSPPFESSLPPGLVSQDERRLSAGELLYREGEPATTAYLVRAGRVRLLKRLGDVERSLRVLREGELLGESALSPGQTYGATAMALTEGSVLAFDRAAIPRLFAEQPQLATHLVQQLVERLAEADDHIELLMLRDPQAKLVLGLLKLAERARGALQGDVAALRLSPVELAVRIGAEVDAVRRSVQQLQAQGYVRVVEERVEILDLAALRSLYELLGLKQRLAGDAPA